MRQARLPVDFLNAAKASIGRTWLVVLNGLGSNWSNNLTENEQFIREFVSYFPKPLGPQIGIMSTTEDYWRIVRSTFTISDSNSNPIQLWWSDCTNGYQDYTNFTAFNNWYQPVMHRYNCSISIISDQAEIKADLNWFA
ncbi:hypothetical protein niasHT_038653 [Heterodera trifolii]|uniref:Uncharacterized protein n=1 Tax=Heterodera trifolii TaxID=157864 RepID=A0ABD2HNT4_9BILA